MRTIDLGCADKRDPKATDGIDFYPYPGPNGPTIVHDLTKFPWPVQDGTFDAAVSHQCIEHLPNNGDVAGDDVFFHFFDEVWRILKPGGTFSFDVPDADWPKIHHDPTHRRLFKIPAFDFLWRKDRDYLYPRKTWEFVSSTTTHDYGFTFFNDWHVRKYAPKLDAALCRMGVGNPKWIYIVLRKPA